MQGEQNKMIVRRLLTEVISEGDDSLVDEILSPKYIYYEASRPPVHGRDGFRQVVEAYRVAFPDLQLAIEEMVAEGDTVATRFTVRGTHRGPLGDLPPTGKSVAMEAMVFSRISNGKVEQEWEVFDMLGMLRQLEALPS